jgi:hypothetical protein
MVILGGQKRFFSDLQITKWHSRISLQQIVIIHHQYKINDQPNCKANSENIYLEKRNYNDKDNNSVLEDGAI